jgi:peptide/nickel transport system permease protein
MAKFGRALILNPAALLSAAFLGILVLSALTASWIFPFDPIDISRDILIAPSHAHPFGTDQLGRDSLAGIVYGARVSLLVGFLAAVAATLVGVVVGAAAGFYGGVLDHLIMRLSEFFQVIPSFVLAAFILALSSPGLTQIVVVIALLAWPQTARLMRAEVIRVKQSEFVDAVRCMGESEWKILMNEVIPNSFAPVLAVGTLIVGQAILLEASLSFLGLSNPDIVSWGATLHSGQRLLFNAWWLSFFPGVAILLTVLTTNIFGDAVGTALDPRRAAGAN